MINDVGQAVPRQAAKFAVLHALKVKGLAPVEAVSAASGVTDPDLGEILDGLVAAELARLRTGRVAGYALTPAGRDAHATQVVEHLSPEVRAALSAAYDAFLPATGRFKQICTRWQMRPGPDGTGVPNDHTDAAYDAGVVEDLGVLHNRAVEALAPAVRCTRASGSTRPASGPRSIGCGRARRRRSRGR